MPAQTQSAKKLAQAVQNLKASVAELKKDKTAIDGLLKEVDLDIAEANRLAHDIQQS